VDLYGWFVLLGIGLGIIGLGWIMQRYFGL
jgi:hypothetical protein